MHAVQQYVRLNNAENPNTLLVQYQSPWNTYYFSSKNIAPDLPRFCVISA